jgi:hypothetical protein
VDQADEGYARFDQSISYRRIATIRIPAQKPFGPQAHAGEVVGAISDFNQRRRHLEDIGAALSIEYPVCTSKKVREGLTIIAIANTTIAAPRGNLTRNT